MVLRANLAALTLAVSVIAAELSALATGLVANHRTAVAVLFAASSGSAHSRSSRPSASLVAKMLQSGL
jgi:hypothetical protein